MAMKMKPGMSKGKMGSSKMAGKDPKMASQKPMGGPVAAPHMKAAAPARVVLSKDNYGMSKEEMKKGHKVKGNALAMAAADMASGEYSNASMGAVKTRKESMKPGK